MQTGDKYCDCDFGFVYKYIYKQLKDMDGIMWTAKWFRAVIMFLVCVTLIL